MANKKIQLKSLTGDLLYPIIDITNFALDGVKQTGTLATQGWVNTAIMSAQHLKRQIVEALPAVSEADADTIYMVQRGTGAGQNASDIYDEYLLINGKFELLGNTAVDLTDISTAIADLQTGKQDTLTAGNFIDITGNTITTTYSAGTNIEITEAGAINATDTTYTAGEGLDLTGTEFSLEVASADNLGGVKVGANINVAADGTISVADASSAVKGVVTISGTTLGDSETTAATEAAVKKYISDALSGAGGIDIVIPDASTTSKGVVTVGTNINVNSGTISVADAATDTKGVVKISGATLGTSATVAATEKVVSDELAKKQDTLTPGKFINITGNTITTTYSAGTNIEITDGGVINATEYFPGIGLDFNSVNNAFELDKATELDLGGVIVGDNISVDVDGKISVADAATDTKGVVKISGGTILGTGADVAATEAAVQSAIAGFITFEEIV